MPNLYPKDLATTLCWRRLLLCTTRLKTRILCRIRSRSCSCTPHLPMPPGGTGLAAYCSGSEGLRACNPVSASQMQGSQAPQLWQPWLLHPAGLPGWQLCISSRSRSKAHQISCMIRSWTCSSSSFAVTGAGAAAAATGAAASTGSGLGASASLLGAVGTGKLMSLEMSFAMLLARAARRCLVSLQHGCACGAGACFRATKLGMNPRDLVSARLPAAAWEPCSMRLTVKRVLSKATAGRERNLCGMLICQAGCLLRPALLLQQSHPHCWHAAWQQACWGSHLLRLCPAACSAGLRRCHMALPRDTDAKTVAVLQLALPAACRCTLQACHIMVPPDATSP